MRLGHNLLRYLNARSSTIRSQISSSVHKMSNRVLFAFDFDHTVVDGNTDVVARHLIPVIPQDTKGLYRKNRWIDYMEKIFEHLHHADVTPRQILEAIQNIPEVPGMLSLFDFLRRPDCDVIVISDSNLIFISTWLEKHGLSDAIKQIYTNPAHFDAFGQLHVSNYHEQNWCTLSSVNMCKGQILETHVKSRKEEGTTFTNIVYVGDGHNDFCPSLRLSANDYVFARSGFELENLIRAKSSENGEVKANIRVWKTGDDILDVIKKNVIKDQTTS